MRFLLTLLLGALAAPALGLIALAATSAPAPALTPTVGHSTQLPIEVLGRPGHVERFDLVAPNAAQATDLWLKVHGLTYEGKASVRMNGGEWVTLNNRNVTYPHPTERAFWGMGGPMSTLRFTVPVKPWKLVSGTNQVEFRFNDLDQLSIGYRVLQLNLLDGSKPLIATNAFTYDDPATWTGASTNAADITEGRDAWYNLEIYDGGKLMRSRCTDCHAHDGRDLKYFNYSSKSIIERSLFHQVPPSTATNIANYIRSLKVPYEPNGRPWNPPYQPGPGLDAKPVRSWAAGAGLEWVLDNDLETLKYLFPDGIHTNSLNFLTQTLNPREIPIAMPLPDWNHWLPQLHPLDAYPSFYETNRFTRIYSETTNSLAGKTGVAAGEYFRGMGTLWDRYSNRGGTKAPPETAPNYHEWHKRLRSMIHWRNTKTWEIMTEFQMEDVGLELYGDRSADRRWFHGEIFNTAPHRMTSPRTPYFEAESMQWYQLQLALNDGNRRNGSIVPIDWGYQHALNNTAWNNPAMMPTYGITILNMLKGYEVVANGLPLTNNHAWRPGRGAIWNLAPGKTRQLQYRAIPVELRRRVAEAVVVAWLRECGRFTPEQYAEAGMLKDSLRKMIDGLTVNLKGIGVDEAVLKQLDDFGDQLFPHQELSRVQAAPKDKKRNR